jgi:hypothetical protein
LEIDTAHLLCQQSGALCACHVRDDDAIILSHIVAKRACKLTSLNLGDNMLSDSGARVLCGALERNNVLKT